MAGKKEDVKPADKHPFDYFTRWDVLEVTKDQFRAFSPARDKDGTVTSAGPYYPNPANGFRVILEGPNASIEGIYFWCLTQFRMIGFPVVDKINDVFTASESSSLFGAGQQRLGLTQDRVMQFLRVIHDMVRSLSVYIRELRAISERLSYYDKSKQKDGEGDSAEKTLKGIFVDLVEGGAKNPASVFGLSQQVGFVILPHLFFETRKKYSSKSDEKERSQEQAEFDKEFWARVDKLDSANGGDFPKDVITVLKRKLLQYDTWRKHTEGELKRRRSFLLRYFRQYYSTIKLYMTWVKPYLKTINRLGMNLDRNSSAEIVRAFETSLVEIEILGRRAADDKGNENCILMTFQYRTKPSMSMTTPDFQHRGPVHVGEAEVTWRSYGWNQTDIKKFKELKNQEDIDLLKNIDDTLKAALEDVEGDLKKYLEESEKEAFPKKEEKKDVRPKQSLFEPVVAMVTGGKEVIGAVTHGFGDIGRAFFPPDEKKDDSKDKAISLAKKMCYLHYKNFKKSHGLATW
jgi:hypothetical protein